MTKRRIIRLTKDLRSNNGHCKCDLLQCARRRVILSNRRIVVRAAALFRRSLCQDRNRDHRPAKQDVEYNGQEREEGDAAEKAGQYDSEDAIQSGSSGQSFYSLLPLRNCRIVSPGQYGKEVGEDAEDEDRNEEFEGIQHGRRCAIQK